MRDRRSQPDKHDEAADAFRHKEAAVGNQAFPVREPETVPIQSGREEHHPRYSTSRELFC